LKTFVVKARKIGDRKIAGKMAARAQVLLLEPFSLQCFDFDFLKRNPPRKKTVKISGFFK